VPRKLKKPFITSLGFNDHAHSVYVIIKTDQGLIGYGECTPSPYINGETHETCFVVGRRLGQALIGKDVLDIESNVALMGKIIYANTSIKSAFDIAFYDILSKAAGKPLYDYLGGKVQKKLFTDYTVSVGAVEEMVDDALKIKENGFKILKIKVGKGGEEDFQKLKAIRGAIGPSMSIRIDANQGWGVEEASATLNKMAELDIQYCEEPIKRYKYDFLPALKGASPIKIMADESVLDHYDAHRLINTGSCDYINIKLGKSSGIFKALKIIEAAQKAEMGLQLGGFLESKLVFTANAHLAHTSECCQFYDFDSPLFAEQDPIVGGFEYGKSGEIILNNGIGLGLEIDKDYLKRAEKLEIK
jgi:L-alanine-DL-glutamate epimerase-like enolase superfamily enzyme